MGTGLLAKIASRILGIGTKRPEETIVGSVINRLVPDLNKRKEFQQELEKEFQKHENEIDKMLLEDVESARQLSIAQTGLSFKDPRAWVRPAWGFVALGMWIVTLSQKSWAFDYWDYGVVGSIVTFYFGARTLERIKKRSK
jgi:hypothetical protein